MTPEEIDGMLYLLVMFGLVFGGMMAILLWHVHKTVKLPGDPGYDGGYS